MKRPTYKELKDILSDVTKERDRAIANERILEDERSCLRSLYDSAENRAINHEEQNRKLLQQLADHKACINHLGQVISTLTQVKR